LGPHYRQSEPAAALNTYTPTQDQMRDQSNAIREQVSFKQREDHIRQTWMFLCKHYKLNKSDLVKFLIKKEEYFLRKPEGVLSGIVHDWM
jgi:hypothetical protein